MLCNGSLEPVAREEVAGAVPPRSREAFECFWRCTACRKVYWQGSHYQQMLRLVERLRAEGNR
jgi:uncharacterized protein with PIN domain